MSLYDVGFAALKYSSLPSPPYNVPLGNMAGTFQHVPPDGAQNHMIAQIASQCCDLALLGNQALRRNRL